ncbi:uncharacterized protein LOC103508235 [Diaphorina citri]|uniref:Uncharacterized protein LOC103508235 n=1 Tax=Diaphorina citri TaxID=121845 RepID=A0A1S3CZI3_DIACI|nr:uncharacterized protein LOC103508235 [Diaphorina citri]
MDVHHSARALGHLDLASAALEHALDLGHSSESSCSCSSSSDESGESFVLPPPTSVLPPLPKPKVKFADTVTHIRVPVPGPSVVTNNVPSSSTHFNGNLGIPLTPPSTSARPQPNHITPTSQIIPSTSKHIVYQTPLPIKFDEEEAKKIKVVHFGVV